jgi:hypothetical protein
MNDHAASTPASLAANRAMSDEADSHLLPDHRHRASDPPVHITREIPLPWLIGTAAVLVVQAVTLYVGQQNQADAIRSLAADIKELRTAATTTGLKAVEYGLRLDDHERRLQAAESRQQQFTPQPAPRNGNGNGSGGSR